MCDSDGPVSGDRIPHEADASGARCLAATWVGTQLRVLAVAGLAASHEQPFARVLFRLPARSKRRSESRADNVVRLDSSASAAWRRRREPSGRYTALWDDRSSASTGSSLKDDGDPTAFALPPALRYVEVQIWNRFPNGVDGFLGAVTVAIKSLRRQLLSEHQQGGDDPSSAAGTVLRALPAWHPLLPPSSDVHSTGGAAAQRMQLSVQLDVRFASDPRAFAIRQKIAREVVTEGLRSSSEPTQQQQQRIADPAFAFTRPFEAIEWSAVVTTSLRHIFFHADVDRLSSFKRQVLYGDVVRELHEDDGLHVHDAYLAAFQLAQLSAQYLDHCVDTLAARSDEYSDQFRMLAATRRRLRQSRSHLKRQRDRLRNERDELDLLLSTYRSIVDKSGAPARVNSPLASPRRSSAQLPVDDVAPDAPESPPPSPVTALKPAFLLTWEERERERKRDKEGSKALRIAEEKTRLEQLAEERRAAELQRQRLSALLERGRQRAANTIQRFVRRVRAAREQQQLANEREAAIRIQARVRGHARWRAYPALLARHLAALERSRMAESELEMRALLLHEQQQQQFVAEAPLDRGESVGSPVTQDVSALVATWRKLRRVFALARTPSTAADEGGGGAKAFEAVFAQLDARQDGVLDRAELRAGVRAFGVRIDRKLTRMLIALVRAKCSAPSQPLLVSFAQFVQGFDLLRCTKAPLGAGSSILVERCGRGEDEEHEAQSSGPSNARLRAEADAKHDDSDNGDEAADPIAIVAQAVAMLRRKLLDAAALHLEARGTPASDYRAFRDALAFVFDEFDADGNGELDASELASCVRAIGLELSDENLALFRDCFGCDGDGDDRISIADFISFALARAGDESLGLVGSRLRDLVLQRVRAARQQTESIDDAVQLVFRRAFPSASHRTCSVAAFTKTLSALQLGAKPAQLARLVMQLDRDGDRAVSFDELLRWLRLRTASEPAETEAASPTDADAATRVEGASAAASRVRRLLLQLAGVDAAAVVASEWQPAVLQVFREIDRNDSNKVTRDEIARFLASRDLARLSTGGGEDAEFAPSRLATAVSDAIDVDRNGVITCDEWVEFLAPSQPPELVAMVGGVRSALQAALGDEGALVTWLHGLSGALPLPSTAAAANGALQPQMKVRVGVFKAALRAKLGATSLPPLAVDEAVKRLDSDRSGWVTTSELRLWTFPPRDLEALVCVVTECWRHEAERAGPDFALALYGRFDADSNGVLAQREIRGGFASFGLRFQLDEVAALTRAFDADRDGCWSRAEFLAFVYQLFPHTIFRPTAAAATVDDSADDAGTGDDADTGDDALATTKPSSASAAPPDERADDDYGDDGFLSSLSSSASSSRAESGEQLRARESSSASS